jgi:hypothetical protein
MSVSYANWEHQRAEIKRLREERDAALELLRNEPGGAWVSINNALKKSGLNMYDKENYRKKWERKVKELLK